MTLRLPTIQRRGLQRPQTPNVSLPLKEAQARASMLSAVGKGVTAVTDMTKWYVDKENKRELRDAQLAVHKADMDFMRATKGVEEFDINAVEDEDFIELTAGMDPDKPIPAHTVFAEWRKRKYDRAVGNAAKTIRSRNNRDDFMVAHEGKNAANYANDAVQATRDQIKYVASQSMKEVEESLLARDYEGARIVIKSSEMSSVAKESAMKDISVREQSTYFKEVIKGRKMPLMENALSQLIANDKKTTSALNSQTRKVLANELWGLINREKTAIKSGVNANMKLRADDLKSQINDMWNGKPVDSLNMIASTRVLQEKYPVLVREARRTLAAQPLVSDVLLSPPSEQTALLKSLKAGSDGGRNKSFMINKLESSVLEGYSARVKDTMAWAEKVGFITLTDLDYTTPERLGAGLWDRLQSAISAQMQYGTSTGLLKRDELGEFGNRLENAPDKLAFFQTINKSLGEYAESFYDQLTEYGVGKTAALAGQLMAEDEANRPTAENILNGADLRKNDPLTQIHMKEQNATLDSYAVSKFNGLYAGNKKLQALMVDAFKDVYAVVRNKDTAFEQLTGDSVEYNGYKIPSPKPGMSNWDYKRTMALALPEYWESVASNVHGYTGSQLREGLIDGSLTQAGVGKGATNLYAPDGDVVTKSDGVTPFVFQFNPNAPTIATRRAEDKAKADAAFETRKMQKKQEEAARVQSREEAINKHLEEFPEGSAEREIRDPDAALRGGQL